MSTSRGLKPGGTCCTRAKLRTRRPAATSTTTESAISPPTSTRRSASRREKRPPCRRRPAAALGEGRLQLGAALPPGRRESEDEARDERDHQREEQHLGADLDLCRRGTLADPRRSRPRTLARQSSRPTAPPPSASSRLSASCSRTRCVRVAPSALRTASSLWRAVARASRRFATLTPAISSTRATAALRTRRAWRTLPTTCSWSGTTSKRRPPFGG